jgi:hypothetical protein
MLGCVNPYYLSVLVTFLKFKGYYNLESYLYTLLAASILHGTHQR